MTNNANKIGREELTTVPYADMLEIQGVQTFVPLITCDITFDRNYTSA